MTNPKNKKKTPTPKDGAFEITARENLQHLSTQRMKRFLNQAHNLRRNLALRKQQQEARKKQEGTD